MFFTLTSASSFNNLLESASTLAGTSSLRWNSLRHFQQMTPFQTFLNQTILRTFLRNGNLKPPQRFYKGVLRPCFTQKQQSHYSALQSSKTLDSIKLETSIASSVWATRQLMNELSPPMVYAACIHATYPYVQISLHRRNLLPLLRFLRDFFPAFGLFSLSFFGSPGLPFLLRCYWFSFPFGVFLLASVWLSINQRLEISLQLGLKSSSFRWWIPVMN